MIGQQLRREETVLEIFNVRTDLRLAPETTYNIQNVTADLRCFGFFFFFEGGGGGGALTK